jgi:hypothetical protein
VLWYRGKPRAVLIRDIRTICIHLNIIHGLSINQSAGGSHLTPHQAKKSVDSAPITSHHVLASRVLDTRCPPFGRDYIYHQPSSITSSKPYCLCRVSRCFRTARLVSIHRSTQFDAQASSVLSRRPDEIFEVMHFFQQVSAMWWTSR